MDQFQLPFSENFDKFVLENFLEKNLSQKNFQKLYCIWEQTKSKLFEISVVKWVFSVVFNSKLERTISKIILMLPETKKC